MKIKRNQDTIPNDNTVTRNRFEFLGKEVQGNLINVRPTPNNEANEANEETRYQTRDVPRLQTLETALIEQREPQIVSGMIQQINRQRERKCL